jgi:hypothetical protein
VLSNLFRVRNRGTRSRHLVYSSKNHKYDFIHKKTSLELGPKLGYVLGRCRHPRTPNLMVGLPLYKEFIKESLIIQKHVNLVLAKSRGKQNMA